MYLQLSDCPPPNCVPLDDLHIDDLAGHVEQLEGWTTLRLPAIAEVDNSIEIAAFPQGHYGDQVDSISQALAWFFARR